MEKQDLLLRFKRFAKGIYKLVESLPSGKTANSIGNQLVRSGPSAYMNYRAAKRGRSSAEFIAKMGIVEEEADESFAWLELLVENRIVPENEAKDLMNEAYQLTAIAIASIRTARKKK
jgi:four helix bundle protein